MTEQSWEPVRVIYCQRIGEEVALEVELVYPPEWMPNQDPRIVARRCSRGMECNLDERGSCVWAGTNPVMDPFVEK